MTQLPLLISILFLFSSGEPSHIGAGNDQSALARGVAQHSTLASADEVTAPQYPGGKHEMLKFLAQNVRYPSRAQLTKTSGLVIMQVTIDKEGQLSDIKAAHSDSPLLDKEPMRVLKLMPKWEPAIKNGVPVSATYLFPFRFNMAGTVEDTTGLQKDQMGETSRKISTLAPDQPFYVSEEVVITGFGVGK